MRCAHRHCFLKYNAVHSRMFALLRCVSAICVVRLMYSGHGSSRSSSLRWISCSRSVLLELLLATSSVEGSLSLVVVFSCRLGVLTTSLSILRCVRLSDVNICLVSVHAPLAYIIVGVTVASKSLSLDCSG